MQEFVISILILFSIYFGGLRINICSSKSLMDRNGARFFALHSRMVNQDGQNVYYQKKRFMLLLFYFHALYATSLFVINDASSLYVNIDYTRMEDFYGERRI